MNTLIFILGLVTFTIALAFGVAAFIRAGYGDSEEDISEND